MYYLFNMFNVKDEGLLNQVRDAVKLYSVNFICLLVLVFSFFDADAFDVESSPQYTVSYLLDSTNAYTVEEVLNSYRSQFKPIVKTNDINFGYAKVSAWLLVKVNSPKNGSDYVLTIENPRLKNICFYSILNNKTVRTIQTGDEFPFNTRSHNHNMFSFTLSDSCDYFLVKVKTDGVLMAPLNVFSNTEHLSQSNADMFIFSLFLGVLVLAFLINTLLYFRVSESIYIYYGLCLIASGVVNATQLGYSFQFIWPNHPALNHYIVVFYGFTIFTLLFSQQILSLKKNFKVLHHVFTVCICIMILAVMLSFTRYYIDVLNFLLYYFSFVTTLYLFSGIYIYFIKKYQPALFYMLAFGMSNVCTVFYILAISGLVEFNYVIKNAFIIGTILQISFLLLTVIDKIYQYQHEKNLATATSEKLMEENKTLLFQQNNRLDEMVKLRTKELELLNDEIENKNEDLNATQDQLAEQNEMIMKQNELLDIATNNLQSLVSEKTQDLEVANANLIRKNSTLEQFGYFTAHNLRGPLSTVLGLISLFKIVKNNPDEHENLLLLLKKSADKMDDVVKDMITLLDFNNIKPVECSVQNMSLIFEEVKESYKSKFSNYKDVVFVEHFKNTACLSDQIIVRFIFDQLIENSFKFKDVTRELHISITEEEEDDYVCFYIVDNGIGFESEKFDRDLFGLYKRFHTAHFSGKGLGLYFIKEYMNRMHGKVSIESVKEVGTTVKLSFAKAKGH